MMSRSIEAEQAVIGSILIDARCLDEVARLLRPQDFGMEINQTLYQVILSLDRAGRKIDPVTVKEAALQAGAEVSNAYLLELMDITPTSANVEEYARIVREEARKRGISALCEHITAELASHAPIPELLMETARRVEDLQKDGMAEDLLDPDSAMLAFYQHRELVAPGRRRVCPHRLPGPGQDSGRRDAEQRYVHTGRPTRYGEDHPGHKHRRPGGPDR